MRGQPPGSRSIASKQPSAQPADGRVVVVKDLLVTVAIAHVRRARGCALINVAKEV